ncbi:DUF5683 domain-containing protein [Flavobacterium sp.]|uniref:DUF5683 domain-containing protein n=1 Tax=Flavobacterium sp. TaxID=239 RepID=UPI003F69E587
MKGQFLKVLLFIFVLSNTTFAQEETTVLKANDTISVEINPLAPSKAAFFSAILPGLGQAYNKKYWKIPIVYGALSISVYNYVDQNKKYNGFRDEYKKRIDGTSLYENDSFYGDFSDDSVLRAQRFHQRNRDMSLLFTSLIYILNIVDANVDAHLMQFNVNDNLSFKPDVRMNEFNTNANVGLLLKYNF